MALLDDVAAALAPTVLGLAGDFGATLTSYSYTEGTAADGTTTRAYVADAAPLAGFFRVVDAVTRDKLFGARSGATAALTLPRQTFGLPAVAARDGFLVTTGPHTGTKWIADTAGIADPAGLTVTVPLVSAPTGAF